MIIPIAGVLDIPTPRRAWARSEKGEEVIWGPVNEKDGWMLAFETSDFWYIHLSSFFPSINT